MLRLPYSIILASGSPRRRELLTIAGIPFEVVPTYADETHPPGVLPEEIPQILAERKATSVPIGEGMIVIGADTIVLLDGKIYEKPNGREDAIRMLTELSGRTHQVVTGVCLLSTTKKVSFSETTYVTFNRLTQDEIAYYVDNYRPYDKAGSYACQEWIGAVAIRKFEGDYFNVVGLPVNRVYEALKNW
ncbi:MAG: Maf family protein [Chitinophagales bacterium]|nr:Maf family protein [Chitinophagales bacterium]MDW8418954.1 Maf family protein [Chitinophagales bacterium]